MMARTGREARPRQEGRPVWWRRSAAALCAWLLASACAHSTDDPPEPAGYWAPALPAPPAALDPRLVAALRAGCNASNAGDDCGPSSASPAYFLRGACAYAFGLAAHGGALYCGEYDARNVRRFASAAGAVDAAAAPGEDGAPLALLSEWASFGGVYSAAAAAPGLLFLALDGVCVPGNCAMPGIVRKVVLADEATGAIASEAVIASNLTAPRQMAVDALGRVLVVLENSPAGVLRIDPATGETAVVVSPDEAATPQGVAVAASGDIFFSEYGSTAAAADPAGHGVLAGVAQSAGALRVKRAAGGAVETLATGIWRARGLALDAPSGDVFVVSEANAWDQGSSGSVWRWRASDGALLLVASGLDYPQFPALGGPAGDQLFVPLARHNFVARLDTSAQAQPFVPVAGAPPGVVAAVSGGSWLLSGAAAGASAAAAAPPVLSLRCERGALALSGPFSSADPAGATVSAWVRVPAALLPSVDGGRQKDGYPGFVREFALPRCACAIAGGSSAASCGVLAEVEHAHAGARWPMLAAFGGGDRRFLGRSFAAGASEGAAAFSEAPAAFLVFVTASSGPGSSPVAKG